MNQALPDWMFAALAIGAWELFDLIARRWHIPNARWAGGVLAGCLLAVVVVRYIVRFLRRDRNPNPPDPDEWKNY